MHRLTMPALLASMLAALAVAGTASAATVTPVMTGLDNPRGLAWGPEGGLYVAEAGRGGSGVCVPAPDAPPPAVRCYGATGAVSRLWHGVQERVASGLPSIAFLPAGDTAAGPQHVSFQGRGGLFVTIGCGCNKATPTGELLDGLGFGYLLQVSASGNTRPIADVATDPLPDTLQPYLPKSLERTPVRCPTLCVAPSSKEQLARKSANRYCPNKTAACWQAIRRWSRLTNRCRPGAYRAPRLAVVGSYK